MTARFHIRDVFEITGRGPVLAGDILDGPVRRGMRLVVPGIGDVTIAAVEMGDNVARSESWVGLVLRDAPPIALLRQILPPGTELTLETAIPRSGSAPPSGGLRRFWFPVSHGLGIGVTAATEGEAQALAEEARQNHFSPDVTILGIIPDVDISTLDAGHVLPNIGPPAVRGVWHPRLNV